MLSQCGEAASFDLVLDTNDYSKLETKKQSQAVIIYVHLCLAHWLWSHRETFKRPPPHAVIGRIPFKMKGQSTCSEHFEGCAVCIWNNLLNNMHHCHTILNENSANLIFITRLLLVCCEKILPLYCKLDFLQNAYVSVKFALDSLNSQVRFQIKYHRFKMNFLGTLRFSGLLRP